MHFTLSEVFTLKFITIHQCAEMTHRTIKKEEEEKEEMKKKMLSLSQRLTNIAALKY